MRPKNINADGPTTNEQNGYEFTVSTTSKNRANVEGCLLLWSRDTRKEKFKGPYFVMAPSLRE